MTTINNLADAIAGMWTEWESLLNPFYSESNAAEHDWVCDYK